jgi:dUTP pyrophosphatase
MNCKIVISGQGKKPTRGSPDSAGYDLYSSQNCVIKARDRATISTGIEIQCPSETYGRIAPRSGLAVKNGIATGAGVIDCDYRGIVKVLLFNHSDEDFEINIGDRIAQLIFEKIVHPTIETVTILDITERGDGGFGSTGI